MRIVALDTSTWWASLALLVREGTAPPAVAGELGFEVRGSHAPQVPGLLDDLLRLSGWSRDDPDGYVVTRGPGSFTGIRVGLGTIRGLSLATGRPCAAVTTLDALVQAHGPDKHRRLAVISAGRGEFYAALYDGRSDPPEPIHGPWLDGAERLVAAAKGAGVVAIPGHGTTAILRELGVADALRVAEAPRSTAAAAGYVALLRDSLSRTDGADLAPLYLRPPDAELGAHAR